MKIKNYKLIINIMNRLKSTFSRLKQQAGIAFCPCAVLGDPTEKEFLRRIKIYLEVQPDIIELIFPFSDPVADGTVMQAAHERALKAGSTTARSFKLIKKIRGMLSFSKHETPLFIIAYANTVLQYGIDHFYAALKSADADAILIPDLPLEEAEPFTKAARRQGIDQIFIVSEYTDAPRLKKIEKVGSGFLYVVSALGVTGVRKKLAVSLFPLIKHLKKNTRLPLMVGFGVSTKEHIASLQKCGADGAIVGSALVKTPLKILPLLLRSFLY